MKYLEDDGTFDIPGFKHDVEIMFTAQEILVGNSAYPTEKIAKNARKTLELASTRSSFFCIGSNHIPEKRRTSASSARSASRSARVLIGKKRPRSPPRGVTR